MEQTERIAQSLLDLIGNTPLLEPVNYSRKEQLSARLLLKLEAFNPGGSVKDRAAFFMLNAAKQAGLIRQDTVIIEPTSGNTGIGLAVVCAVWGLKLILTMPESMSIERRQLLAAYGADLVLTPAAQGMTGAIAEAERLAASLPSTFIPGQFSNPANAQAHYQTTAEELWRDSGGQVDLLVAGVGTSGTITGLSQKLREYNPQLYVVAVEPAAAPILSEGRAGSHDLQGIGPNFVPELFDKSIVDEIMSVTTEQAFAAARALAAGEGLLAGISGGAALYAATLLGKRLENQAKNIVCILPDGGEKYLSTPLYQK